MNQNEEKALKYFYLYSKKQLKDPKCTGVYKFCFTFVKTIKDLSNNLGNIYDLEEVLSYED